MRPVDAAAHAVDEDGDPDELPRETGGQTRGCCGFLRGRRGRTHNRRDRTGGPCSGRWRQAGHEEERGDSHAVTGNGPPGGGV